MIMKHLLKISALMLDFSSYVQWITHIALFIGWVVIGIYATLLYLLNSWLVHCIIILISTSYLFYPFDLYYESNVFVLILLMSCNSHQISFFHAGGTNSTHFLRFCWLFKFMLLVHSMVYIQANKLLLIMWFWLQVIGYKFLWFCLSVDYDFDCMFFFLATRYWFWLLVYLVLY